MGVVGACRKSSPEIHLGSGSYGRTRAPRSWMRAGNNDVWEVREDAGSVGVGLEARGSSEFVGIDENRGGCCELWRSIPSALRRC
jgi:hypothetical protein